MAITVNNETDVVTYYSKVLERVDKGEAKFIIENYFNEIFNKYYSKNSRESLLRIFDVTSLCTNHRLYKTFKSIGCRIPIRDLTLLEGVAPVKGALDIYYLIHNSCSCEEYSNLVALLWDSPIKVYYNKEVDSFTTKGAPGKTFLVANIDIRLSSGTTLTRMVSSIYKYIVNDDQESFDDMVNHFYRSLKTKFKNRYKHFLNPQNNLSGEDVMNGESLPEELDINVLRDNPQHIIYRENNDVNHCFVREELERLYINSPESLHKLISKSTPLSLFYSIKDDIRQFIYSNKDDYEWIRKVFNLSNPLKFIEDTNYAMSFRQLDVLQLITREDRAKIVRMFIENIQVCENGNLNCSNWLRIDQRVTVAADIINDDPSIMDDIDINVDLNDIYVINRNDYIHNMSFLTTRTRYYTGDQYIHEVFFSFLNSDTGLFIVEQERDREVLQSIVSLMEERFDYYQDTYNIQKEYSEIIEIFNSRVKSLEASDDLDFKKHARMYDYGTGIARLVK